jgi:hypothetical protein
VSIVLAAQRAAFVVEKQKSRPPRLLVVRSERAVTPTAMPLLNPKRE